MARKKQTPVTDAVSFKLSLDINHPDNLKVLASMSSRSPNRRRNPLPIASPTSVKDPSMNCGSHPDIVEIVWGQLGRALPEDGRCLIYGSPALVHAKCGVILAVCFGTAYALRLPKGCKPPLRLLVQEWSDGGEMNIENEYGKGWMFGNFSPGEVDVIKELYDEYC